MRAPIHGPEGPWHRAFTDLRPVAPDSFGTPGRYHTCHWPSGQCTPRSTKVIAESSVDRLGLMTMQIQYHKTVKHFNIPGHAHCLTFSCWQRMPLLDNDSIRLLFLTHLARARESHNFALWAYVLMPNHVHLLIRPLDEHYSIAEILKAIKQPVGFHGLKIARKSRASIAKFWQTGPGFDENIVDPARAVEMAQYIHNNPVRKELVEKVEDWRWSSARYWLGLSGYDLKMDAIE